MSFASKTTKKWFLGSFSLALHGPRQKEIFEEHLSFEIVEIILFCLLDHEEPMKNYPKTIFWWFLKQNSSKKIGN
jgi:hypothetical protein